MKVFAIRHYKDGRPTLFSTKEKAQAAANRWKTQGLRDFQGFVEIDDINVDSGEEEMSKHNHCYHVTGIRIRSTYPTQEEMVCCFCRDVYYVPREETGTTFDIEHGPYAPVLTHG